MVIFFELYRTAVDQKSSSGLPMTGEDTGLGALASPLAGYLGKVQERAASLEYCPWCSSKGLTYALRSYRINLQESITLCTNPQCLFPLVSRPLEDVLASLVPVEPTVGNKRSNALALEKEELIRPVQKRPRSSDHDSLGPHSISDTLVSQTAVDVVNNGQHAASRTDDEMSDGHRESPAAEATLQDEDGVLDKKAKNAACTGGSAPTCLTPLNCSSESDVDEAALSLRCGAPGSPEVEDDTKQLRNPHEVLNGHPNQTFFTSDNICSAEINTPSSPQNEQMSRTEQKSLHADVTVRKEDTGGIKTEIRDLSSTTITESEELVSVPKQLFWRNSDSLCWLDSLLVALVNCKSLRKCKPEDEPQRSSVWQLMRGFEDACAAIQVHQQTGRDGVVRVPSHVLQKASADLQRLRMSVFKLLQPKLHCRLGQRETPVFAMPLLLQMDSWVEPLFRSTFHWEFRCSECNTATTERVTRTLPSFTNVLPDWSPLEAVHLSPCNMCRQKNQRRTMMLESVSPVFMLHFVEGLPVNDVQMYSFTFKGRRYSITTVIQYNQQLKHFVTWICNPDGSWLEYDDLKHPDCKTHQKLLIPAQEMHVVFWEVEEDKEPSTCSPSTTVAESPPSKTQMDSSRGDKDSAAGDLSLLVSNNDIIGALSASEVDRDITDTTAIVDTSIGSTTLLDTFEGLSHNDIITLTLVELKDEEMQPLKVSEQTEDVPDRSEMPDTAPDSSSPAIGCEVSQDPDAERPTTPTPSNSGDGSSSDPTFVPGGKKGRGRRTRQTVKKVPKAARHVSPPSKGIIDEPVDAAAAAVQDHKLPVESAQQAPPVSSTDTSPLSTTQKSPTVPPQSAKWSFLLSKHPLNQVQKAIAKLPAAYTPASVTRSKLTPPPPSTPCPVQKQPGGLFLKPQLRTESEGLPLKAAEMYCGFGVKSSNSPVPSQEFVAGNHQKTLTNATVASPATAGAKLTEISSPKKQSSRSSKLPPGLTDTEVLRYKLIKKLKAKKKKLAKLNELLGQQGGAGLRPDSTDLGSPNTVTSSTYDGSICDDFLSDLLSPATTASNLSPDSSGFLEMPAKGQDGGDQLDCGVTAASQLNAPNTDNNFLDEFLSQAVAQRPTEMESEALSALELFI